MLNESKCSPNKNLEINHILDKIKFLNSYKKFVNYVPKPSDIMHIEIEPSNYTTVNHVIEF